MPLARVAMAVGDLERKEEGAADNPGHWAKAVEEK